MYCMQWLYFVKGVFAVCAAVCLSLCAPLFLLSLYIQCMYVCTYERMYMFVDEVDY